MATDWDNLRAECERKLANRPVLLRAVRGALDVIDEDFGE